MRTAQVGTLRKYRRAFKIGDPQQAGTKDELLPAVVRHWQNQVRHAAKAARSVAWVAARGLAHAQPPPQTVDEDETLLAFVFALRKQSTAAKKPGGMRGGSK